MSLAPGTRIGHYEILSLLGRGGMGEVYRARDTRPALSRDVAIKVLSGAHRDQRNLARFEREARATAAIAHPNVLAIYDIGTLDDGALYLVEEFIQGATLRVSMQQGAMAYRRAIELARSIAEGLAAAHAKGIVHRDLKPENVMIAADGRVKILDFGIAAIEAGSHDAVTITNLTGSGTLLGTVAYMSPEQVRGQSTNAASDLFSLGIVLYEMLAGERPFVGASTAEVHASILNAEPPAIAADRGVPAAVERVVMRCLEKRPENRFQSASDLAFALGGFGAAATTGARVPSTDLTARPTGQLWRMGLALVVGALGALASSYLLPDSGVNSTRAAVAGTGLRVSLVPSTGTIFGSTNAAGVGVSPARLLALSPDGTHVVFVASRPGSNSQLWLRDLASDEASPLPGTEGATFPFWSPDGTSVAYYAQSALYRTDLRGTTPTLVCRVPANLAGGTWNRDGQILFGVNREKTGIHRVAASGGEPEEVTTISDAEGETRHFAPSFLPDGRHFFFLAVGTLSGGLSPAGVFIGTLGNHERLPVPSASGNVQYSSGFIVFPRGQALVAQRFDTAALTATGDIATLAEGVRIGGPEGTRGAFSLSQNGHLAYMGGDSPGGHLSWVDRAGRLLTVVSPLDYRGNVALSPDDSRVALTRMERGNVDVWIQDVDTAARAMRLTFDPALDDNPVWSPDGKEVLFRSQRDTGVGRIFKKASDGSGLDVLVSSAKDDGRLPMAWFPNGRMLAQTGTLRGPEQLLSLSATDPSQEVAWRPGNYRMRNAAASRDGRWVAYTSSQSGQEEVYVSPAESPGGPWQVSSGGGNYARWRRDGRELYYVGGDSELMSVGIEVNGTAIVAGPPRPLFELAGVDLVQGQSYAPAADGQRFLVVSSGRAAASQTISLLVNWPALLPR